MLESDLDPQKLNRVLLALEKRFREQAEGPSLILTPFAMRRWLGLPDWSGEMDGRSVAKAAADRLTAVQREVEDLMLAVEVAERIVTLTDDDCFWIMLKGWVSHHHLGVRLSSLAFLAHLSGLSQSDLATLSAYFESLEEARPNFLDLLDHFTGSVPEVLRVVNRLVKPGETIVATHHCRQHESTWFYYMDVNRQAAASGVKIYRYFLYDDDNPIEPFKEAIASLTAAGATVYTVNLQKLNPEWNWDFALYFDRYLLVSPAAADPSHSSPQQVVFSHQPLVLLGPPDISPYWAYFKALEGQLWAEADQNKRPVKA